MMNEVESLNWLKMWRCSRCFLFLSLFIVQWGWDSWFGRL